MELIGKEEMEEALEVLESGFLFRYGVSIGDESDPRFKGKVFKLEEEVARTLGVAHSVAVNSGTSALLAGLAAIEVGPGDEVIVPGYTFVASFSSVIYSRAVPVMAEIDRTFNLDPEDVERKITPRTRAIMPVHMAGNPARMNELKSIAQKHRLKIIEDCAQAFGASYHGKYCGSMGDVGAFSFNAYKTLTCGDGGMVVTNDEHLYRRAFAFHDQGHSPLRGGVEVGKRPFIGLDFRMTEVQGAIMLAQLKKLDALLFTLRRNKARYKELISDLPGLEFREITDPEGECATMLTLILPNAEVASKIAKELGSRVIADAGWHVYNNMEHILQQRTVTQEQCPFKCPIYAEKGGHMEYRKGMLPQTDELLNRSLNISIGVSDPNLGAGFGVTIKDSLEVVEERASNFRKVAEKYLR
jgi:dTDP-4-amino-4,6-dideoxygalactose transaminase